MKKKPIDLYCKCNHAGRMHFTGGCMICKDKAERRIISVNEMCWDFKLDNLGYLEWKYETSK